MKELLLKKIKPIIEIFVNKLVEIGSEADRKDENVIRKEKILEKDTLDLKEKEEALKNKVDLLKEDVKKSHEENQKYSYEISEEREVVKRLQNKADILMSKAKDEAKTAEAEKIMVSSALDNARDKVKEKNTLLKEIESKTVELKRLENSLGERDIELSKKERVVSKREEAVKLKENKLADLSIV